MEDREVILEQYRLCLEMADKISERRLNNNKFFLGVNYFGELEKHLPLSPFYEMEWKMLGEGEDKKLYIPFSKLEQNIPLLIGGCYFVLTLFLFLNL